MSCHQYEIRPKEFTPEQQRELDSLEKHGQHGTVYTKMAEFKKLNMQKA